VKSGGRADDSPIPLSSALESPVNETHNFEAISLILQGFSDLSSKGRAGSSSRLSLNSSVKIELHHV